MPCKWLQVVFQSLSSFPRTGCGLVWAAGAGSAGGKPWRQQVWDTAGGTALPLLQSSSVTWACPCNKLFWDGHFVPFLFLVLREQLRPELKGIWFGKSFFLSCWELHHESIKRYRAWSFHKTQLPVFPIGRSKTEGTNRSYCPCPASPTLPMALDPMVISPCPSDAVGCCSPCPAIPEGAASPSCSLTKIVWEIEQFSFKFCLSRSCIYS